MRKKLVILLLLKKSGKIRNFVTFLKMRKNRYSFFKNAENRYLFFKNAEKSFIFIFHFFIYAG